MSYSKGGKGVEMAYRGKVLIVCIWAIILHSHQYVFVYSVHCFCLWQFPEYCITGVPVWVHTEAESAVPSKVTEPGAEQAVSGNGNLRSRCLLAVSRLSPDLLSVRPHLRPHADFLCPPALSFYSEVHVEVPGKAAVYVSFFFFKHRHNESRERNKRRKWFRDVEWIVYLRVKLIREEERR